MKSFTYNQQTSVAVSKARVTPATFKQVIFERSGLVGLLDCTRQTQMTMSSCLRTLTTWHCPHSPAHVTASAIDRYLLAAGPTAANLQQRVCCCEPMLGQKDGQADMIRYDTRCYFNVRSKADMSQLNVPHGRTDRQTDGHCTVS